MTEKRLKGDKSDSNNTANRIVNLELGNPLRQIKEKFVLKGIKWRAWGIKIQTRWTNDLNKMAGLKCYKMAMSNGISLVLHVNNRRL